MAFKLQIGGFIAFFVVAILGPLAMFTTRMTGVKRKGLTASSLSSTSRGSIRNGSMAFLPVPIGAADIQSLADLGNSFALVRDMGWVPFGLEDIVRLATFTAAPFLPLLLTIWSPEELIMRVFRVVF